jgi:hypothetical protein
MLIIPTLRDNPFVPLYQFSIHDGILINICDCKNDYTLGDIIIAYLYDYTYYIDYKKIINVYAA